MQIWIKAFLVNSLKDIEEKSFLVNDQNYVLVRKKLESQRDKAILILKNLHEKNEITSIYQPKNKKIQEDLDKLVTTKKGIKNSIEKIKIAFM